jgi:2-polyprenyl-6-methoxyphenol hydroxylase-like FAD-dependent oxidoreductase
MIQETATLSQEKPIAKTDIAIIGGGIIGLFNALQYAKRGLHVTLIDDSGEKKQSYKVGESLLLFTTAFMRTIGDLDPFLQKTTCFPKQGVWFTYGMEQAESFEQANEWGVQADPQPPHYLYDLMGHSKWFRSMFIDMQIVRPEAENYMKQAIAQYPTITFLDTAHVNDITFSQDEKDHQVSWISTKQETSGVVQSRWVLDCSGRRRLLAKKFGHNIPLNDGFQTTALWAQFSNITDELFAADWSYTNPEGEIHHRDRYTLHLWGKGYWLWVIRLAGQRISIGVNFDQRTPPAGTTPQEQFWNIINRYPTLQHFLSPENMLEFRMYRNVQYITDTFISPKRYAMVGDAGAIIDAYYSQGIALALVTSWHLANVIERDLRDQVLDTAYIQYINEATKEDWQIIRNMLREKYSSAIQDNRFFLLSHILDMTFLWAVGPTRAKMTHWLVDTEGYTSRETEQQRHNRTYLQKHLFYSRVPLWGWLKAGTVQTVQRYLQHQLAERARWRIRHGIKTTPVKSILSLTAPIPQVWKLASAQQQELLDISGSDLIKPAHLCKEPVSWLHRLPVSTKKRLDWLLYLRPYSLILLFVGGYLYDGLDTFRHKLLFLFGHKG